MSTGRGGTGARTGARRDGVCRAALAALTAWCLVADPCQGETIIAEHDWNAGTLQGWFSDESWVSLDNPGFGGNGDSGFLRITLAETALPQEWEALVRTPATNLFAGAWTPGMSVAFDFLASNSIPEYVQVRWSGTNDRVWRATVFDDDTQDMDPQAWTTLGAPAFQSDYWNLGSPGGGEEAFLSDLASIDWIGVFVWRGSGSEQIYGLDDFRLMVPEPGQATLLLASALIGMATLRAQARRDRSRRPAAGGART